MVRLAVIGLGGRATGLVAEMMKLDPGVKLAGVVDPDVEGLPGRLASLGLKKDEVRQFPSVDRLLNEVDRYDALLIGTRCDLHSPLAVKVASTHLPLFLEKPVAISVEQLRALHDAYLHSDMKVVVSFPLRYSPLFKAALEIVRSGRLGTINQIQGINNVPYGGVYYAQFYREDEISHGLWLQKATHDFDYLTLLADSKPTQVAATSTRLIFGGDKPQTLRCSACDETEVCFASPRNVARTNTGGAGMGPGDHWCVFGDKIRNQDAGSALIEYASKVNVNYTQNFVTRRSAGRRGAIITGFDATLEFDWFTEAIRVVDHHNERVDNISVKAPSGHMGGDQAMLINFLDVVAGKDESFAPLSTGLLSVATCLAADESCRTHAFEPVPMVDEIAR